jgi:hypothetical protein
MKKLLLGVVPLLAVVAFAVMPAMASAATKEYGTCVAKSGEKAKAPCEVNFVFTPFKGKTEAQAVISNIVKGTTFELVVTKSGASVTCTTFSDKGKFWNEGGVGHSTDSLIFDDCTTDAILSTKKEPCDVKNIELNITDEVVSETEVKITVVNEAGKAVVETSGEPAGCTKTALGKVEGSTTGTDAKGTNKLVFKDATGLTLSGEPSTISGSNETFTEVGGVASKPVFIN